MTHARQGASSALNATPRSPLRIVDLVLVEGGADVLPVADNRQHRSHSHPPAPPQQPIMSVPGLAFAGASSFPTREAVTGLAERSAPDTPPACPREGDRQGLHCLDAGPEALHQSPWGAASRTYHHRGSDPSGRRLTHAQASHVRLAGGGDTLVRWKTALCSASITRRIVSAAATPIAGAVARSLVEQSSGGCRTG